MPDIEKNSVENDIFWKVSDFKANNRLKLIIDAQSNKLYDRALFENLCSTLYLGVGFEFVRRNRGAPSIDGVSIADFEANLDEEPSQLQQELTDWTYQLSSVRRRVEIPKPDGKGGRRPGIPKV